MWRRTDPAPPTAPGTAAMPRDVEALEQVLAALDEGVTGETDAHVKVTTTMVGALGFAYGGVWMPADGASGSSPSRVSSPPRWRRGGAARTS